MSARCPHCHDLFVPESGLIPAHFLDLYEGTVKCEGSDYNLASIN